MTNSISSQPGVGPAVALASSLVLTLFLAMASSVTLVVGHREKLETGLFVVVFVVLVPLGLSAAQRQTRTMSKSASSQLAALNLAALAFVITAARLTDVIGGLPAVETMLLIGALFVGAANLLIVGEWLRLPIERLTHASTPLEIIAAILLLSVLLEFYPEELFNPARFALCSILIPVLVGLYFASQKIQPRKCLRRTIDAIVLVAAALLVTDVNPHADRFRYDYDFFLGPVIAIRHGDQMLVDTFSQYGVGMLYTVAGALGLLPLTYGGFQLLLGVLNVIEFSLVYGVLRVACMSQFVAATGLAIAVLAKLVFPGLPHIANPSTGSLRFGLPWIVILAGVFLARSARRRPDIEGVALLALAVAAVWSFEVFVYTAGAYLAVMTVDWSLRRETLSTRVLEVRVGLAITVCLTSVGTLTVLTRALAGAWPDWAGYLDLIRLYSVEEFGTLLIPAWSPGYLVAASYVVSTIALLVVLGRPNEMRSQYATLVAIAGSTAYGALSFSYFLGRSAPTNLHHVAVPAVVTVCCWLTFVQRRSARSPSARAVALGGTVLAAWLGVSVLAQNPSPTAVWLRTTPLVQFIRSPSALGSQTNDLLGATRDRPEVTEGSRLLQHHANQADERPVVLLRPDVLTSVLLASGQGNALPIANGNQDRLIGKPAFERVRTSIRSLSSGTIALTEERFLRRSPSSFARDGEPVAGDRTYGSYFIALAVEELRRRFHLRVVARGRYGLVVVSIRRRLWSG